VDRIQHLDFCIFHLGKMQQTIGGWTSTNPSYFNVNKPRDSNFVVTVRWTERHTHHFLKGNRRCSECLGENEGFSQT
jgi:hypothetical protein